MTMSNGFSRFNKTHISRFVLLFIVVWFYCTLSYYMVTAIESKDFEASARVNTHSISNIPHSRRKRFLAFPLGSSFATSVCLTVGVIGNPNFQYLSFGLNWGLAYDLPNATWALKHTRGGVFKNNEDDGSAGGVDGSNSSMPMDDVTPMPAATDKPDDSDINGSDPGAEKNIEMVQMPMMKRRERRDLYGKLETLMDSMGYNGRDCVLRALCESRQYFRKNKLSMIGEMLRVVFSLPKQRLFTRELHENSGIELYDHAFRRKRDVDCSEEYDCSFSLLELAFGKYSSPPPGYYS